MKKKLLTAVIGLMLAVPAGLMAAEMAVYKEEGEMRGSMNNHGANGSVDAKLMQDMKGKVRPHMGVKGSWLGYAMEGSDVEISWSDYDGASDPFTVLFNAVTRPNTMMIKLKTGKYDLKRKKDGHLFGRVVVEEVKGKDNTMMIRFENVQGAK